MFSNKTHFESVHGWVRTMSAAECCMNALRLAIHPNLLPSIRLARCCAIHGVAQSRVSLLNGVSYYLMITRDSESEYNLPGGPPPQKSNLEIFRPTK